MKIKIAICLVFVEEVEIDNQRVAAQRKVCHQGEGSLEVEKSKRRRNRHNTKSLNMWRRAKKKILRILENGEEAKEQKARLQTILPTHKALFK